MGAHGRCRATGGVSTTTDPTRRGTMAPERISRAATILPRRRSPANVYGVALMLVASGGTEAPGGESEEWIVTRETSVSRVTTVHDLSGAKSWPGGWRPEHKPAYTSLLPDRSGRIRVSRELASERVTDCTDPADWNPGSQTTVPCWRADRVLDAFDHVGCPCRQRKVAPASATCGSNSVRYVVTVSLSGSTTQTSDAPAAR